MKKNILSAGLILIKFFLSKVLKPFTAKIKVIIHKGTETQASRMLVDIVLQDVAMQLSEVQYATFCHIYDSLIRAVVNR